MSDGNFLDVAEFHMKMDIPRPTTPTVPADDVLQYRVLFMEEELDEFRQAMADFVRGRQAHLAGDELAIAYPPTSQLKATAKMADALIDLVYVAMGTAYLMGLPWRDLWDEVQRANMAKERAASPEESASKTGRGHSLDVVKPVGWTPPDIEAILQRHGWRPSL